MAFQKQQEEHNGHYKLQKGNNPQQRGLRPHIIVNSMFIRVVDNRAEEYHQDAYKRSDVHA
jgi:hypothetical protein